MAKNNRRIKELFQNNKKLSWVLYHVWSGLCHDIRQPVMIRFYHSGVTNISSSLTEITSTTTQTKTCLIFIFFLFYNGGHLYRISVNYHINIFTAATLMHVITCVPSCRRNRCNKIMNPSHKALKPQTRTRSIPNQHRNNPAWFHY